MIFRIILFIGLLAPAALFAQVRKQHRKASYWPSVEVTHTISEKQFVFFDHQWRFTTDPGVGTLSESGVTSGVEEIRFTLGYEHNFTDHWRGGLSQRIAYENNERKWYSRFNLRHKGKIGSLAFVKRALYEHIRSTDISNEPEKIKPENRVRADVSVEQKFTINDHKFSAALEYEARMELGAEEDPGNPQRRIDRTRLQGELNYFPSPKIGITVYAIKQTRYYNVLPTFNEFGEVKVPGGKLNRITPIFGIELQINTNLDEIDPLRNRR